MKEHIIKIAKIEERKAIIEEIRRMNLWTKGTVEGTRSDIIVKLQQRLKK